MDNVTIAAETLRQAAAFAENGVSDTATPGLVIALYRVARGVTGADVARRVGVSRQRISGIEATKATPATAQRIRTAIDELAV